MTDPFDLTESLYSELEQRARALLGLRRMGDDPETRSLVNQACLKLLNGRDRSFATRAEFLSFAAKTMRHVLIDLVRARATLRRGGGLDRVPLEAADREARPAAEAEILDVHEKLHALEANDPRLARLVELKFFGGCTTAEIADALGTTAPVVEAEWQFARVWLRGSLSDE